MLRLRLKYVEKCEWKDFRRHLNVKTLQNENILKCDKIENKLKKIEVYEIHIQMSLGENKEIIIVFIFFNRCRVNR